MKISEHEIGITLNRIVKLLESIATSLEGPELPSSIQLIRAKGGKIRSENAKRAKNGRFLEAKRSKKPAKTQLELAKTDPNNEKYRKVTAVYCEAYKLRYETNPIITWQTVGFIKALLKTLSFEKVSDLVQAYLQMDDPWFLIKCHDFGTLYQNLNKVSASLAQGTKDPHEKKYWDTVFGRRADGREGVSEGDSGDAGQMGREALQRPSGSKALAIIEE